MEHREYFGKSALRTAAGLLIMSILNVIAFIIYIYGSNILGTILFIIFGVMTVAMMMALLYVIICYGVRDGMYQFERKKREDVLIAKYMHEHKCSYEKALDTLYPEAPAQFIFMKRKQQKPRDIKYDKTLEFVDPKKPNKKEGCLDMDDFNALKQEKAPENKPENIQESEPENVQKSEKISEDNQKEQNNFNQWGQ